MWKFISSIRRVAGIERGPGQSRNIEERKDEHEEPQELTVLQRYRIKYAKSKPRYILETLNAIMSLLSVCIYVYDTYIPIPAVNRIVYFVCSWTFSVEYLAKLAAAKEPLRYLLWDWSLIDLGTIAYGFISFFGDAADTGFGFARLLRIVQVARLLKVAASLVLRYSRRNIQPMQLEYVRRSVDLALTLTGVTFIAGCVFYELEVAAQGLQLHQAVYWSCVTIATIGYGDYAPTTVAGQLLFPLVILIIILVLPRKISDLSEVMQTFSRFMRRVHVSSGFGMHVVLTGHVTPLSAQTFIGEFFHPDRGYQDLDLLLLRPCDPEPQLVITMNHTGWERRVNYLHGSPFKAEDLARVDAARALAVFVMANKYAPDPAAEDTRTLLAVLAIAQFLRQFGGPDNAPPPRVVSWSSTCWRARSRQAVPASHQLIVAQFLLNSTLDNAVALLASGALHPPEMGMLPMEVRPFPICVGHLRASLLGASVHTPGLITLVSNLCITCSLTHKSMLGQQDISLLDDCGWLAEYLKGAGVELYDVSFPKRYWGLSFKQAALQIWREEQVILLGLRFPNHRDERQRFDAKLAPLAGWRRRRATASTADLPGLEAAPADGNGGGDGAAGYSAAEDDGGDGLSGGCVIDSQTIGFILNDDALVLGAAAWGVKSALDPHDSPELLCAKATYPVNRTRASDSSQRLRTRLTSPTAVPAETAGGGGSALAASSITASGAAVTAAAATVEGGPTAAVPCVSVVLGGGGNGQGTLGSVGPEALKAGASGSAAGGHHGALQDGLAPVSTSVTPLGLHAAASTSAGAVSGPSGVLPQASPADGLLSQPLRLAPAAAAATLTSSEGPASPSRHLGEKAAVAIGGMSIALHAAAPAAAPDAPALVRCSEGTPRIDEEGSTALSRGTGPQGQHGAWAAFGGARAAEGAAAAQGDHRLDSRVPQTAARADSPAAAADSARSHRLETHRQGSSDSPAMGVAAATGQSGPSRRACCVALFGHDQHKRPPSPGLRLPAAAPLAAASVGILSRTCGGNLATMSTARNARQQGLKASIKPRDVHTLAAVSMPSWRRTAGAKLRPASAGRESVRQRTAAAEGSGEGCGGLRGEHQLRRASPPLVPPQPVATFTDREPLDSPVIIAGSSCFSQLPQVVAAIRAAPPVGSAARFRLCPIVIMDDSKTSPHNPYKALLSESLLSAIARVPGALPERIFVLRGSAQDAGDVEKLNLKEGCMVHALLVPNTELYMEEAVVGSAPALADGQVMLAADALRRYCEEKRRCNLSVVSEVLALLNCSYALPLCLPEGPYRDDRRLRTQQPSQRHLTSLNTERISERLIKPLRLLSLRPQQPRQSRQEAYVQYILSSMPHLSPSLAPGHMLMQTFMDALLCQTLFNPMMLQILLKMLHCWGEPEADEDGKESDGEEWRRPGPAEARALQTPEPSVHPGGPWTEQAPLRAASCPAVEGPCRAPDPQPQSTLRLQAQAPTPNASIVGPEPVGPAEPSSVAEPSAQPPAVAEELEPSRLPSPPLQRQSMATDRECGGHGGLGVAGASTTVRVFCFNFASMLRRVEGLRQMLLRRAAGGGADASAIVAGQGAPAHGDREGDGAGANPDDAVEEDWYGAGGMELRVDGNTPLDTVGGRVGAAQGPPLPAVCFGALFEVLVEKYDMLPLGLYRRDAGPTASSARSTSGGASGGPWWCWWRHGSSGDGVPRPSDPSGQPRVSPESYGLPYVYTKPDGFTTWLRSSDDVYVLTSPAAVLHHMRNTA